MRRAVVVGLVAAAAALAVPGVATPTVGTVPSASALDGLFPAVIPLPDGFQPEGIVTGRGTSFYVGSLRDGTIYRGDLRTGEGRVNLGGASLECGDGLLRRGRTLYAVQGASNQIAVVRLGSSPTSGTLVRTITDPDLDVPATIAPFGPFLYAVNGRFSIPPTTDTPYQVVRLPAY